MTGSVLRNMSWVYDHARMAGRSKNGIASGMVTVGDVVRSLGFSPATVRKHFGTLVTLGHMELVVNTRSVQIYRVKDLS